MDKHQTHHYGLGYSPEELKRLECQHRVWDEDNQRFLSKAGFKSGDTLVDLGCGPGYTSLDLARIVGPQGRIIAVDRDDDRSLARLKTQARVEGLNQIEAVAADINAFDLPEESVDGVFARWVLIHMPEKSIAPLIRRMATWLRPGGTCLLAEYCNYRHITLHPPSRHLPALTEAIIRAAQSQGSNLDIGNTLPGLLHSAGLEVEVNVTVKAARAMTDEWQWPDNLFQNQMNGFVDQGILDRHVLDAFLDEWNERSGDPGTVFFGWPVMYVMGKKSS